VAGTAAAQEQPSAARLRRTVETLSAFGTRHTASTTEAKDRGIGAARRWLKAELEGIEGLEVFEQRFSSPGSERLAAGVEIVNVCARLPGRDPRAAARIHVVSGHYDSRASDVMDATSDAPGANDDASGVAVVLELARLLAKERPEATVLFACVAGEEQGLLGSRALAEHARKEGWAVASMFTNDIVGNTLGADGQRHDGYVRCFSEGLPAAELGNPMAPRVRRALGTEGDSDSRQLARYVREQAAAVPGFDVKLVFRPDRFLRGGDHLPFNEAGFAAVRFTEPVEDYRRQHQDVREGFGDLPEHVDWAYLARVAAVNLAALRALANAPAPPSGVLLHCEQLEAGTTLSWDPNPEADLSHYEVLWRDTTAPDWEHARRVDGTEVTLDYSKDDFHFGVRAVDRDGHKSPVRYPQPKR